MRLLRVSFVLVASPFALVACLPAETALPPSTARAVPETSPVRPVTFGQRAEWAALVLRDLAQQLWQLGPAAGERTTEREKAVVRGTGGFKYEARGPQLGSNRERRFFEGRTPASDALLELYRRHCRLQKRPDEIRLPDGHFLVTLEGVEPRSDATCVIKIDSDPGKRWRFVVRLESR